MKSVKSFAVQGVEVSVPWDEEQEFAAKAAERNVAPDEIKRFRVTFADGNARDVTVPQSEVEEFRAKAKERGATFEPMRTLVLDDGTEKTMPVEDISRYLRSQEYRSTEDYKKSKEAIDLGSPTWAGGKGAAGGAFQGFWAGGNAVANKITKAIPEVGIGIESMVGQGVRFLGKGVKVIGAERLGSAIEKGGEAIVGDAAGAKAWLDSVLPSEAKEWTGYEDWSTEASDWVGNASAMAVKFAPGGAEIGGKAFLEACFASDGANAFANTYDTAIANGADPTKAAALGGEAALINYFAGKALMKAGGVAEYVNGAGKKFVASGLGTSAVMATQGAGNKAVENLAENRPVMEGVAGEAGKGAVEGFMFHVYNAIPGVARAAAESRAESRRHDEFVRELIVEHAKTEHGAAQLAAYFDGPALDEAITARKSGGKLTRRMADDIGLPKAMPLDEAESVVDAVTAQRRAMAERVRLRMDDVQAQSLAETLASYTGDNAELFKAAWLKAVEKLSDAKEMDDPAKREEIVAKAVEEVSKGDKGTEMPPSPTATVDKTANVRLRAESGKAMLLLKQMDEGTLPVVELDVGLIEGRAPADNGNTIEAYDPEKAKPIVVLEDLEGNYHALTGGKRLSIAAAAGAEKVKAVVVREADGWTKESAEGLSATENLREGNATVNNIVAAVDTIGADGVGEIAGWHQANGSREFASKIRRGLDIAKNATPELKDALADGSVGEKFAFDAAKVLSMERLGENWQAAQKAVTDLVGNVGQEELEAVLWGMQKKLSGKAATPEEITAVVQECREEFNRKHGGAEGTLDSDTTLVETGKNELKTIGEVESGMDGNGESAFAEGYGGQAGNGERGETEPLYAAAEAAKGNKAVELKPIAGSDGTFTTLAFPDAKIKIDGERKVIAVDGLTVDDFAGMKVTDAAALVASVEAKAAELGLDIGFYDDGVRAAWEGVKENIKAEGAAAHERRQLAEKSGAVVDMLQKSFPEAKLHKTAEEWAAALKKHHQELHDGNGEIYAFVDPTTGDIYLNPDYFGTKQALEAPIHEYGHLGIIATKKVNKAVYDRGMKLANDFLDKPETAGNGAVRGIVDFILSDPVYSKQAREVQCEELLAQLIGKRGEEALRAETSKTVVGKIKSWLVEFWNTFGKALGLKEITPEQAERMTVEQVADAIRAEMFSGRKYGEGLKGVEFADGGARAVTKPVRVKRKLTGRRKAVNEFVKLMGGAEDPSNTETDMLALWVDNGGRLFDKLPFESETSYSKGKSGVKKTRSSVADEFAESTAFYQDLDPAQRKVFFGTDKLEYGAIGEGLKNKLAEAGITRFTREDGTIDYEAAIAEFERQWTNYERGNDFLKERGEYEEEAARQYVEEMERAEAAERAAMDEISAEEAAARSEMEAADAATDAQIAEDIAAGRFSRGKRKLLFSRSGIFTGTAADYANRSRQGGVDDGPSVKKIGTGEGSQVYGWGLYGSTVRGVAEGYANQVAQYRKSKPEEKYAKYKGKIAYPKEVEDARDVALRLVGTYESVESAISYLKQTDRYSGAVVKEAIEWLEKNKQDITPPIKPSNHLYEQTFFTDRAPGDESHLLKWYDAISDANWDRVIAQAEKEGLRDKLKGAWWLRFNGDLEHFIIDNGNSGDAIYERLSKLLGTPQAASEFLARAGIDGVKYPVDSYGGKGVKDGDVAGWNYVSFRDDNIRVDHKWTDGQLRFSKGKKKQTQQNSKYSYAALTAKPAMKVPHLGTVKTKSKLVNGKIVLDTDNILSQAVENVKAAGVTVNGRSAVHVADLGRDVVVDKESLRHTKPQAIAKFPDVYANYGQILANSIVVNEATPADPSRATGEFVMLGMAYNRRGRPVFVRSIIDSRNGTDKLSKMEVVYAVDAQKGNPAFSLHADGLADNGQSRAHVDDGIKPSSVSKSETEISIADFLTASKGVFGDVFSKDVNANIGAERDDTKLGKTLIYSRGTRPEAKYVKLTRVADDAGVGEQTPGALAASAELSRTAPTPLTTRGTRYVSLPLSEMNALARWLTGHAMPAEMSTGRKLGVPGKASTKHRKLVIAADVVGSIDKTDAAKETATLKQHGFFRNEDPNWVANHSPVEVRQERVRSEEALSTRLEALADRRAKGTEPGGMAAGRKVFADQLAKVVMSMPHGQPGVLGAMQTVGGALERRVRGNDAEADAFLDWMEGRGTGNGQQGTARNPQERKAGMFGAFLMMPKEMEQRARGWYDAIRSTIAGDQKLADAFRMMTVRSMTEQGYSHLEKEILRAQSAQTEQALKKLREESNAPIAAGGLKDRAAETVVLSCHDRMGAALVRVDASVKLYLAAQKKLMASAPDAATKAAIKQQTDLFMGAIAQAKNQAELSRTAWERGHNNADARYLYRMVDILNEATVRDGLKMEDVSLYLDQQRVIETKGLSGSRGESARQAQLILDAMKRRLGAADYAKVEAFARKFAAIHEQELLNDPVLERILGKGTVDYWRGNTHYVTTKRQFSPEELAEIEAARAAVRAANGGKGDDVVGEMFKFAGRAGMDTGAAKATARLKGSFSDKQEVMSATFEKVAAIKRWLRRCEYVIELRDLLKLAKVEGVHDFAAGEAEFPDNSRYGHISYMENGRKRVLVVPKEIADGFKAQREFDTPALKLCASVNNIARQLWIDWNPVYWQRNIGRNVGSIEMNMPGMKESAVKRGLRFVFPGLAPTTEIALTHLVRHMPEKMSLPLRKIWGEHTALFYAPKAKRMAMWLTDHNEMQKRLWEAQDRGDLGTVQEMLQDQRDMLDALRGNMLVGMARGEAGGTTAFLDDSVRTVGKTMAREIQEMQAKPKWRRALEAANIFSKNAKQQVFEDVMAKFAAYLHDRAQFGTGNNRTVSESGLAVKKNVSIGEGERKGKDTRAVQAIFQPFWNMVEKGVVRNVKAYGERSGETFQKAAWRIAPMILHGLVGSGAIAAWILKANDGDEDKVLSGPMADVYRYAREAQRAYQNCSNYVRENYHVTPLMTDGYTSIVLGMPLTDEERLLKPIARFVTDAASVAAGTKESLDVAKALHDATLGVVAPDFKLAGALPTLFDDTIHALWDNPNDYYTGGQKYDNDIWLNRNENWEMRGKFAMAMAKRLWNDFGGRNVLPVDRAGVDNGLGRAPGWVAKMVNDIPLASPILRSFVKVQVGSPKRDAAEITEVDNRRRAACRVHAKELFEIARREKRDLSLDRDRYTGMLKKWQQSSESLSDEDLAYIEQHYLNAWRAYEGAQYRADGEREKFRAKADKLGLEAAHLWLDFD